MNTATHTTRRRLPRRDLLIVLVLLLGLPLVVSACTILEVLQPLFANVNQIINIQVTVEEDINDKNPWRGVLGIMVPDDWSFASGDYSGDLGTGAMLYDPAWSDSLEIFRPADDGYVWLAMLSDQAYSYNNAPLIVSADIQLQVGATIGQYELGYIVTKDAFSMADLAGLWDVGAGDSLFGQPIEVQQPVANEGGADQPDAFALAQNYPNPFNPATTIRYTLERSADVTLTVLDATGREVAALNEGRRTPGSYALDFDARDLPSGTYLYQLRADGEVVATRRMTLAK